MAAGSAGTELKRARGDRCFGQPQRRRKHKRALTARQRTKFLATLGLTCNVTASAKAARRSARVFYDLRRRDSGFRAAWMEALREGYDHLELEMLHRARFGVEKDVFHLGVKTATTRVYADAAALRLLHLHRPSVAAMRARDEAGGRGAEGVFDRLVARLNEIEGDAAGDAANKEKQDEG
ncbi:MAG TPA: hypothetical protein VGD66_02105 [Allosphingosinicella sp.]